MATNIFPGSNREDETNPDIPVGVPVDDRGNPLIPDLGGRNPTRNEAALIAGQEIHLGSTNVGAIWYAWEPRRLFVRFLDGSVYSYESVPLDVAVGMVETDSPGRYVWNVLRANNYAYRRLAAGTKANPKPQVIRKH